MRCPKCHYLSFDPEPRCRNCGYDLEVADADLALHAADSAEEDSVPDLTLHERPNAAAAAVTLELIHTGSKGRAAVAERSGRHSEKGRFTLVEEPVDEIYEEPARQLEPEPLQMDSDPELDAEPPPAIAPSFASEFARELAQEPERAPEPIFRAPHTTTEMPLFVKGMGESDLTASAMDLPSDDIPVVPATRPPLAVRRAAPESVRAQTRTTTERRLGPLDHDLLEDLRRVEREEAVREREPRIDPVGIEYAYSDEPVEPRIRLAAAGIDVAVLGGIAAFVFWATLRLCNVSVSDVGWSALIPFVIFIAVMDLTYLLMFTAAGGQTVGKMLMHIRVVGEDQAIDEPVALGRAAWRAGLSMISVVALGLGWLPALFGRGLTIHDRLAHTRVVRA